MVFKRNRRGQRKMFHPAPGEEWICAKCGGKINELPFVPSKDRPVYHRECLPIRP